MTECSCGRVAKSEDRFCGDCGKYLRFFICKFCFHKQKSFTRFCTQCGKRTVLGMLDLYTNLTFYNELTYKEIPSKEIISTRH